MKHIRYTKELLEPIVSESYSIAEVIRKLGIVPKGGNFGTVRRNIIKFDLCTSHFTGPLWSKGKTKATCEIVARNANNRVQRTVENSLIDGTSLASSTLYRLVREIGIEEKCASCGIGNEWNGKPIRLHIDHCNGNGFDNRPNNLRFLCPNCHSQTPTYGSKNSHTYIRSKGIKIEFIEAKTDKHKPCKPGRTETHLDLLCEVCNQNIKRGKFCSYECTRAASRRTSLTDAEILDKLKANDFNYLKTGRDLGISDNAVRKRVRYLLH